MEKSRGGESADRTGAKGGRMMKMEEGGLVALHSLQRILSCALLLHSHIPYPYNDYDTIYDSDTTTERFNASRYAMHPMLRPFLPV